MKTINRGWLLRQAREGALVGKCNYHLTDDYAYDKGADFGKTDWLPVRIRKDYNDFVTGVLNLWESDLQGKPGRAWREEDGTICLVVHSNLSYQLKFKERR